MRTKFETSDKTDDMMAVLVESGNNLQDDRYMLRPDAGFVVENKL